MFVNQLFSIGTLLFLNSYFLLLSLLSSKYLPDIYLLLQFLTILLSTALLLLLTLLIVILATRSVISHFINYSISFICLIVLRFALRVQLLLPIRRITINCLLWRLSCVLLCFVVPLKLRFLKNIQNIFHIFIKSIHL